MLLRTSIYDATFTYEITNCFFVYRYFYLRDHNLLYRTRLQNLLPRHYTSLERRLMLCVANAEGGAERRHVPTIIR